MSIRIIITGGTFDKRYDELQGQLNFKQTHLPQILRQARVTVPIVLETTQLIDSLYMTDADQESILSACQRAQESQIVIIHGTDKMVETAQLLGAANLEKSIILTGAMVPYQVFDSDALFNLGCSIGMVQLLPNGVYVSMNGRYFPYHNVRKNREKGVFEPIV